MATSFPTSLDTFINPLGTNYTNSSSVPHASQHANANDAIRALQIKVGVNNSTDQNSLDAKTSNLKGRLEGWNDLVEQVVVQYGAQRAPSLSNITGGIYAYKFDPGAITECFVNFHLGHDYIPGSMVYPHVHWTTSDTDPTHVGNVRWGIEYTWARRADSTGITTFGSTNTLYIDVPADSSLHHLKHMVSESQDGHGIPGATMEVDTLIMARVFRAGTDTADTYGGSINLLSVDLHYQSLTKTTPLRVPPFV